MAIRVEERFTVNAPPEAVWSYLVDPRQVVTCLPGAELTEVVGRIVQLGRGMVEQVSHQIFGEFSACVRATLEAAEAVRAGGPAAPGPAPRQEAVAALPLLFRALWGWVLSILGVKRAR